MPPESTIADTWDQVARSVAAVEHDPRYWQERFGRLLEDFHFLPGDRILAGAGLARQVTLANYFVMGLIDDSVAVGPRSRFAAPILPDQEPGATVVSVNPTMACASMS
jgi:ribonucleotide reductase alpha subunit